MSSPTQDTLIPDSVDKLLDVIVSEFARSSYPHRTVDVHIPGCITLHIRMPPSPLAHLFDELGLLEAMKAMPAIEQIELDDSLQRRQIFTKLVYRLSLQPGIRAVAVTNVANAEFSERLAKRCLVSGSGWSPITTGNTPRFAPQGFFPSFVYERDRVTATAGKAESLQS